ncbi:MAG: class I SAM-dependent methyltransferase family protein [Candidatus Nanohaloarchaea archaeon]
MEQEKLESKVEEIWKRQGFDLEKDGNRYKAGDIPVSVFSSASYSPGEVESQVREDDRVFVDTGLAEMQERLGNQVSIIEEEEESGPEPPSFEIIGDIAMINDLAGRDEDRSVEAILDHHPRIKTVLLKEEGLSGEFRVGDYRKLYGDETETVHTEHGCSFRLDPTEVYYSERFSTERQRVVDQIEEGEDVLVMFAGVGPFAVMAARNAEPDRVVAVEKNPEAARYLDENVEMNDVGDTVEAFEGDVADLVPEMGGFDRIVMPLPGSADRFLDLAVEHLNPGGTVHYYRFRDGEDWEPLEEEVRRAASKAGVELEVDDRVVCGQRGAYSYRVCLDLSVSR